jgi:hypothetical protein
MLTELVSKDYMLSVRSTISGGGIDVYKQMRVTMEQK